MFNEKPTLFHSGCTGMSHLINGLRRLHRKAVVYSLHKQELMRVLLHHFLLLLCFFPVVLQGNAQTIDTIVGSDDFPQTSLEIEGCTICKYDFHYGSTFSYTPSEAGENCLSSAKDQYIGFVTNTSGDVSFLLETFACISGNGLKVGLYDEFSQQVYDCFEPEQQVYRFANLTPNALYFLRLAGIDDDACGFNFNFLSGILARPSCATGVATSTSIESLGLEIFQSSAATLEVIAPTHGSKLSLVDLLGREVFSATLQQDINQLYVDHLVAGTYFVIVRNGAQTMSKQWVKR